MKYQNPIQYMKLHWFNVKFERLLNFDILYQSSKKCFRGVRWKKATIIREHDMIHRVFLLQKKLLKNKYKLSPYQSFIVYEPKVRNILATYLVDRIVQRAICDSGLYNNITRSFIYDNGACQVGKGVDFTLRRIKAHMQQFFRKNKQQGWILRLDVHHFFQSIPHDQLKNMIKQRIDDQKILKMLYDIIDSFGDKGLGLDSQISQLFALMYLNPLDHFIKEKLHIKHYVRYMDDLLLIHEDKNTLLDCWRQIKGQLKSIGLELNHKTALYPLSQGIKMLKWHFYLTDTGSVKMVISRENFNREKRRIKRMFKNYSKEKLPNKDCIQFSLQSWIANAERGNSYKRIIEIKNYYKKMEETYGTILQCSP